MELRVLEYFVVTATEKSMTKAAERLHITQPTLSIQLRDLEEEVGAVLFNRTNRGIVLTSDGEYFFAKAKEILSLVSTTVHNLQSQGDIAGELRLGGAETMQNEWLFSIIHDIQQEYPRISVHFNSDNADNIIRQLDTGLIEFAVAMGDVDTRKYNTLPLPYTDTWILLTHKDSPLASNTSISKNDIVKEPLIISDQTDADIFIAQWMGVPIEELHIIGTYNLVYNASLMAKAGIGSVLTVEGLVNTEGTNLVSIPLKPTLSIPSILIWKKNQPLSPIGNHLLETLKKRITSQA